MGAPLGALLARLRILRPAEPEDLPPELLEDLESWVAEPGPDQGRPALELVAAELPPEVDDEQS